MSNDMLASLLILLNGSAVLIGLLLKYQAPPGPVRRTFYYCLASYSFWMSCVLLFRINTIPEFYAVLLSRGAFVGGMLSIVSMGRFLSALSGYQDPVQWRLRAVYGLAAAAVLAALAGTVETGVDYSGPLPRPVYGPLHLYFTAATGIAGVYFIYIAYRGFRSVQSEVLKYQMQRIFTGAAVTFVGAQITNAVIPVMTGSSQYSVVGVFWPIALFAAIVHILIRGQSLVILQSVRRLLESQACRLEENLSAFRQYVEAFRFALEEAPPGFDRPVRVTARNESFLLRVMRRAEEALPALEGRGADAVPGLFNRLADLEKENLRLTASLLKAEAAGATRLLPESIFQSAASPASIETALTADSEGLTPLEAAEKLVILKFLEKHANNQAETSRSLGIRPNTLINKMRRYGIATSRQRR